MLSLAARTHALLDRSLALLETVAAIIAGSMMLFAMVFVGLDVLLRYVFNSPIRFQYYFTTYYLLVGMITMGISWGFRTGGYIRVSFLLQYLPPLGREVLLRVGLLASAVYVAILTWTAGGYFITSYNTGRVIIEQYNWSVAWSWVWIPIGCSLLTARLVLTALGPSRMLEVKDDLEGAA